MMHRLTLQFRLDLMSGVHDLANDTIAVALYTAVPDYETVTAYTTTNEISGTGYTAGGVEVDVASGPALVDGAPEITFEDAVWQGASFSARAALLYNKSRDNKSIAVFDFGSSVGTLAATFTVVLNDGSNPTLRF